MRLHLSDIPKGQHEYGSQNTLDMATINSLPPEILLMIFQKLRVRPVGNHILRAFLICPACARYCSKGEGADLSLFNAARVCKSWRDIVFGLMTREDVTTWRTDDWKRWTSRMRELEKVWPEDLDPESPNSSEQAQSIASRMRRLQRELEWNMIG